MLVNVKATGGLNNGRVVKISKMKILTDRKAAKALWIWTAAFNTAAFYSGAGAGEWWRAVGSDFTILLLFLFSNWRRAFVFMSLLFVCLLWLNDQIVCVCCDAQ